LEERLYRDGGDNIEGRRITSLVIRAVKNWRSELIHEIFI
jgi:hypothetical protein